MSIFFYVNYIHNKVNLHKHPSIIQLYNFHRNNRESSTESRSIILRHSTIAFSYARSLNQAVPWFFTGAGFFAWIFRDPVVIKGQTSNGVLLTTKLLRTDLRAVRTKDFSP